MKAFCRTGGEEMCFCELSEPQVAFPDDVKIKIRCVTIASEDLRMDIETDFYSRGGIMGYEMTGEIVELGTQARSDGFSIGDRVTGIPVLFCGRCHFCISGKTNCCNNHLFYGGTLCEYVVWKSRQLIKLDDSISDAEGCLLGSLGEALETIDRASISIGSAVAVIGGDYMGQLLIQLARLRGASQVTMVENQPFRIKLAQQLGATDVIHFEDPLLVSKMLDSTQFNGYDVVFITSRAAGILEQTLEFVAKGGRILFTTNSADETFLPINLYTLYVGNITVGGVYLSSGKLPIAAHIAPTLPLNQLITAEYRFEYTTQAYQALKTGEHFKIAIHLPL